MRLLISGEGPTDIGTCNNAQGVCSDAAFSPGPMAIWLTRLWAALLHYDLLTITEAVVFVNESELTRETKSASGRMHVMRGKNKPAETGLFFNNARQLGLMAKRLLVSGDRPVMAVFFRDADGTRSAPNQQWRTKWDSILGGFKAAEFHFGVPMLPKPKSEAWLLCATKQGSHSFADLEGISGNDDSPHSAKSQLDLAMGQHLSAADLAEWGQANPADWSRLLTMPSFKEFFDRFHTVANAILMPAAAAIPL